MNTPGFIVEFLGTFIFLYVILQSGNFGNVQPFVIVAGLLVAILMFSSVSGGHFNPAVTTMMYAKEPNAFNLIDVAGFIGAQVLGGLCAYKVHSMITTAKAAQPKSI